MCDSGFVILDGREEIGEFALVSPDAGTCGPCWGDFRDVSTRRFGYPFTNCTHCGPRYTIIEDIRYDRAKTMMSGFVTCELCRAEYGDPADRRFHAQPNPCAVCGPSLCLVASGSSLADERKPQRGGDRGLERRSTYVSVEHRGLVPAA